MLERCARGPESGAGSVDTQSHPSPPSDAGTAPAGTAPSIQATTALSAVKGVAAKARRPSGHSTSASTHCGPLFLGETVYVGPKAGSWSRASQTTRASE
jgi:hypothetical protein